MNFIQHAQKELRQHGYRTIIAVSNEDPEQEAENLMMLQQCRVEGILMSVCHKDRNSNIYNNVKKQLHVIHAGIALGTVKGRDLVPDVSLALSTALNRKAFPEAELSYDDAIRYLRKEAVTLPADAPRGFTLVTYRQQPLGFVKNIGNRANNLYPQEWKIKSSHIPTSASSLPCHPIEP